ncbi:hypothetical protein Gohar_018556 [Gossypium harknessii]|uniref:Uncharacterized protein n=3 Tax=Gossypium TaxID=3633 RepID=A0A7J9IRH3_9ROSI|nr:hypothetical protein [Gossypium raimondii]MBA0794206.1 hypothetical protein [Gossypium harknessii]MBA0824736.1 hypothetical protein [Gossypium armourianum]
MRFHLARVLLTEWTSTLVE